MDCSLVGFLGSEVDVVNGSACEEEKDFIKVVPVRMLAVVAVVSAPLFIVDGYIFAITINKVVLGY
jgi:hypothetical protein